MGERIAGQTFNQRVIARRQAGAIRSRYQLCFWGRYISKLLLKRLDVLNQGIIFFREI